MKLEIFQCEKGVAERRIVDVPFQLAQNRSPSDVTQVMSPLFGPINAAQGPSLGTKIVYGPYQWAHNRGQVTNVIFRGDQ